MMLDATQNFKIRLQKNAYSVGTLLFPIGYSGMYKIEVAQYRTEEMQVVSGAMGKERVHYRSCSCKKCKSRNGQVSFVVK